MCVTLTLVALMPFAWVSTTGPSASVPVVLSEILKCTADEVSTATLNCIFFFFTLDTFMQWFRVPCHV